MTLETFFAVLTRFERLRLTSSDLRCRPLCHLFVLLSLRRHRHLAACCRESIARISGQHDLAIFKLWQSHCNNSFA